MARMPILWKLISPVARRPFAPLIGGPVLPSALSGARLLLPTDLSPLFAWWYGEDDASIDTSSSNVWTDHAGVGPALTQSTAGLRGTESVGLGVSFDSDDVLNVAGAPNGGWDAVAVFTANSDNSTWRTLFWDQSVMHACLLEAGTNRLGCYNNVFVDSGLTITPGQKVILVVRMDVSGNVSMSLNGGAFTGTITTFTAGNRQINSIGSSAAGAQPVGTVHDISLYSGNLSSTDTDKAVGSRAWDWGTQADLAGGHPYASAPPMVGSSGTAYNDNLSESAAAADGLNPAGSTFGAPLSETSAAADSAASAVTFVNALDESAVAADSVAATVLLSGSLNEAVAPGDAAATAVTFAAAQSETTAAAADLTSQAGFGPALGETVAAAASAATSATFVNALGENAAAADTVGSAQIFTETLGENVVAAAAVSAGATTFNEALAENLAALQSLGVGLVLTGAVDEAAVARDAPSASTTFAAEIDEQAIANDNLTGALISIFPPGAVDRARIGRVVRVPDRKGNVASAARVGKVNRASGSGRV